MDGNLDLLDYGRTVSIYGDPEDMLEMLIVACGERVHILNAKLSLAVERVEVIEQERKLVSEQKRSLTKALEKLRGKTQNITIHQQFGGNR